MTLHRPRSAAVPRAFKLAFACIPRALLLHCQLRYIARSLLAMLAPRLLPPQMPTPSALHHQLLAAADAL